MPETRTRLKGLRKQWLNRWRRRHSVWESKRVPHIPLKCSFNGLLSFRKLDQYRIIMAYAISSQSYPTIVSNYRQLSVSVPFDLWTYRIITSSPWASRNPICIIRPVLDNNEFDMADREERVESDQSNDPSQCIVGRMTHCCKLITWNIFSYGIPCFDQKHIGNLIRTYFKTTQNMSVQK